MLPGKSTEKKTRLKKIAHIIAGMIILLHAYERYESGHASYIVFAVAGIIFLGVALFHHQLLQKFKWIDVVFFCLEGMLSLVIAYEYFHAHKIALPFVYLFAALLQLFGGLLFAEKQLK